MDASTIQKEVISHLESLVGANVKVTLEVEAEVLGGVPTDVERIVRENSKALKFKDDSTGFEAH